MKQKRERNEGGAAPPSFEWAGFGAFATGAGATTLSNVYGGYSSAHAGPGTPARPAAPYASGLYTTFVLGAANTSVFVGPSLWFVFPGVAFAAGAQGAGTAANRVTLGSATLYDFQVYNTALSAAQVIGLSEGARPAGC